MLSSALCPGHHISDYRYGQFLESLDTTGSIHVSDKIHHTVFIYLFIYFDKEREEREAGVG